MGKVDCKCGKLERLVLQKGEGFRLVFSVSLSVCVCVSSPSRPIFPSIDRQFNTGMEAVIASLRLLAFHAEGHTVYIHLHTGQFFCPTNFRLVGLSDTMHALRVLGAAQRSIEG